MAEFNMEIAGHTAAVTSLFESTPHQFSRYRTDRQADFSIQVTPDDLIFEQAELDREAAEEGFRRRCFTDPFLERAAIQRAFAEYLLSRSILLLHGSTVAVDGKAYLFTARSGTGKSTHTRFWMETFGPRALMVNDDKPFLQVTEAGVLAHGSPWSGKHGLDSNVCLPLAGICLLERGSENVIRPATPEEMLPMLFHESYEGRDPAITKTYRILVESVARQVPLWRMHCTRDPEAAAVAYGVMSSL